MLCYNRGWLEQYVESENSEGKEIKIGFQCVFLKYFTIVPTAHDSDVSVIRDFA